MFEKAAKCKLRFSFKGVLMVEDLWDFSLSQLDELYRTIISGITEASQGSLFKTPVKTVKVAAWELRKEIVGHIFKVKQDEDIAATVAVQKASGKKLLLDAIAEKQKEELTQGSLEDLKARLASL